MKRAAVIILLAAIATGLILWRLADPPEPAPALPPDSRPEHGGIDVDRVDGADAAIDALGNAAEPIDSSRVGQPAKAVPAAPSAADLEALQQLRLNDLYSRAETLRGWVEAGWAQAVVPWLRIAVECIDRPPKTEREMRDRLGLDRAPDPDTAPERLAQQQAWAEHMLRLESLRRDACRHVLTDDSARILDWLELALTQREHRFLVAYVGPVQLIPEDDAWTIRHAERLAAFNDRFLTVYFEELAEGALDLLGPAWRIYAGQRLLPEPDLVRMQAWLHAAELAANDHPGWSWEPPVQQLSSPMEAEQLNASQQREAERMGAELYERCCLDARMPR